MSDDERRRRYELNVPNLPITHVLADGSEFKLTPSGKCIISPANGTQDAELTPWQGAVLSALLESHDLLKRLVRAMEGRS